MNIHVILLVFLLIFSLALQCAHGFPHPAPVQSRAAGKLCSRLPRLLKPRTPDDCPACRLAATASSGGEPAPAAVRPWREVKSRRGAPKRINTEGYACPNPQCAYYGITEAQIHALVGDGKHSQAERIQTFRCQACHTTISARHDIPLYRLKTPSQQVAMVLSAAFRRAGPIYCRARLRLPADHDHHLAVPCGLARSDVTPALFLPPPAPARAVG